MQFLSLVAVEVLVKLQPGRCLGPVALVEGQTRLVFKVTITRHLHRLTVVVAPLPQAVSLVSTSTVTQMVADPQTTPSMVDRCAVEAPITLQALGTKVEAVAQDTGAVVLALTKLTVGSGLLLAVGLVTQTQR
jgi:hypothetical protein